jgi:hypothetical protein
VNTNDRKINAKIVEEGLTAFIRNKNKIAENVAGMHFVSIISEKLTVNHVEAKMYVNLIGAKIYHITKNTKDIVFCVSSICFRISPTHAITKPKKKRWPMIL